MVLINYVSALNDINHIECGTIQSSGLLLSLSKIVADKYLFQLWFEQFQLYLIDVSSSIPKFVQANVLQHAHLHRDDSSQCFMRSCGGNVLVKGIVFAKDLHCRLRFVLTMFRRLQTLQFVVFEGPPGKFSDSTKPKEYGTLESALKVIPHSILLPNGDLVSKVRFVGRRPVMARMVMFGQRLPELREFGLYESEIGRLPPKQEFRYLDSDEDGIVTAVQSVADFDMAVLEQMKELEDPDPEFLAQLLSLSN